MIELSIVIPVLNEAENVSGLSESLRAALKEFSYEVIWVDDGSTDATAAEIRKHGDEHTRLICLTRRFGQTAAMTAGIDAAEGELIVTLDGDQQNNPSDSPKMVAHLRQGDWDVVAGFRRSRKDNLFRVFPSLLANGLIRKIS